MLASQNTAQLHTRRVLGATRGGGGEGAAVGAGEAMGLQWGPVGQEGCKRGASGGGGVRGWQWERVGQKGCRVGATGGVGARVLQWGAVGQ